VQPGVIKDVLKEIFYIGPGVVGPFSKVVSFCIPVLEAEKMSRYEIWGWLTAQNELQKEMK